jgi:GGDEF domain-containing protein
MLVSVEIDAFRDINNVHGPETGDRCLRLMGERIRRLVGGLGPVARIAGSEFAFTFDVGRDDRELHAVMTALLEEMARPIKADTSGSSRSSARRDWSNSGWRPVRSTPRLRQTNLARTTARAGGLGNWAIYHPEMTQIDTYRKWIEGELSTAIRTCAFNVVYQPQVESRTGQGDRIRSAAALGASGKGLYSAVGIHFGGREVRPDQPDRNVGARTGLQGRGAVPRRRDHCGQRVAEAAGKSQLRLHSWQTRCAGRVSRQSGSNWRSQKTS